MYEPWIWLLHYLMGHYSCTRLKAVASTVPSYCWDSAVYLDSVLKALCLMYWHLLVDSGPRLPGATKAASTRVIAHLRWDPSLRLRTLVLYRIFILCFYLAGVFSEIALSWNLFAAQ